jgi:hypothetical protein
MYDQPGYNLYPAPPPTVHPGQHPPHDAAAVAFPAASFPASGPSPTLPTHTMIRLMFIKRKRRARNIHPRYHSSIPLRRACRTVRKAQHCMWLSRHHSKQLNPSLHQRLPSDSNLRDKCRLPNLRFITKNIMLSSSSNP